MQAWLRPRPLAPLTHWDVEDVLRRDCEHWRAYGYGPWLVHQDGIFCGRVGVRRSELLDGLELAFAVMPDAWGKGIATRAASAAVELARGRRLGTVVAFTIPRNEASVRVMKRLGMTCAGTIEYGGLQRVLYRLQ